MSHCALAISAITFITVDWPGRRGAGIIRRKGRFGWWWDVGGIWYFYPGPIEGPPTYISDTEVADDTTSVPQQPLAESKHYAFYYHPGDLKGIPYDTIEGCTNARQQAGNVGICVLK